MIPLTLTAEQAGPDWPDEEPPWGYAIIKLGGNEIGRTELTYNEWDDGREGLEQAAARFLSERLAK